MDNWQITKLALSNEITRRKFRGVFSRDTLPRTRQAGFYVVNLDTQKQPGSHWVAIEIGQSGEKNKYFDSYGGRPKYGSLRKFLGRGHVHSRRRVQHPLSTTCGQWCLYFMLRRNRGWALEAITKPFENNIKRGETLVNDHVVNMIVNREFDGCLKVIDRDFLACTIIQSCRSLGENERKEIIAEGKGKDVCTLT